MRYKILRSANDKCCYVRPFDQFVVFVCFGVNSSITPFICEVTGVTQSSQKED